MELAKVIAIDGPSGSGKSTVARSVAKKLGILYVDTGAMFRALAWMFSHHGMAPTDVEANESKALHFLQELTIEYGPSAHVLIRINGLDLTQAIREHHISTLASQYSRIPLVRTFLLNFQRALAREKFCVMEGRDIGTVVFPNAFCKIFLTASVDMRAKRRLLELQAGGDTQILLEQVKSDLIERDERDLGRAVAPLAKAVDADQVDTTALTPEEVLNSIVALAIAKAQRVAHWDLPASLC